MRPGGWGSAVFLGGLALGLIAGFGLDDARLGAVTPAGVGLDPARPPPHPVTLHPVALRPPVTPVATAAVSAVAGLAVPGGGGDRRALMPQVKPALPAPAARVTPGMPRLTVVARPPVPTPPPPPVARPVAAVAVTRLAPPRPPVHRAPPPGRGPPRVAVVIDDLGFDRTRSRRVIALPAPLTLSFLPYAPHSRTLVREARAAGHEVMVHMPMEPVRASADPGPGALRVSLSAADNLGRLDQALAAFDGYVGLNNHMGSRFTADAAALAPILAEVARRGLVFLDSLTSARSAVGPIAARLGIRSARRDVFLDVVLSRQAIAAALAQTARIARRHGTAVAIGHPHRLTVAALGRWLAGLAGRGIAQAPISAVARAPTDRALAGTGGGRYPDGS